jgi:cytidylate kinase
MNLTHGLERCRVFIDTQLQPAGKGLPTVESVESYRAVTLSRQTGSGAHIVAEKLAHYLQAHTPKDARPWTVFDRNLVEKVLEDHHMPNHLAKFMLEDKVSEITDTLDEFFGLHPSSWTLVRQTADTILRLVDLGNAIVIGRGATVLTSRLPGVFHVRLVGSLEKRAAHMQELQHLSREAAVELIQREDRGRQRYLKEHFKADIDNPLLYHIVINTDLVPYEAAARMIADAMLKRA